MVDVDVDSLVEELTETLGCTVARAVSKDPKATELLRRLTTLRAAGAKISPNKATKALKDNWGISVSPPRLGDHLRGVCSCRSLGTDSEE